MAANILATQGSMAKALSSVIISEYFGLSTRRIYINSASKLCSSERPRQKPNYMNARHRNILKSLSDSKSLKSTVIWCSINTLSWTHFCLLNVISLMVCHNFCLLLTFNMWGRSYLSLTRSISWLLMPWLLASPGHQQPWYWLCKKGKSWFHTRKDFNYLWHVSVEEWHKM